MCRRAAISERQRWRSQSSASSRFRQRFSFRGDQPGSDAARSVQHESLPDVPISRHRRWFIHKNAQTFDEPLTLLLAVRWRSETGW